MDIDSARLQVVGGFTQRVLSRDFPNVKIKLTTDRRKSLEGADFVITSIRPGGNRQRVYDERIPYDMGLFSTETHGPGGFAFALRVVPPMIDIAKDVAKYAPDAWLINTTNPAGIVTQAILQNTNAKVVGMCHGGITILPHIATVMGVDVSRLNIRYTGLNHLGWILGVFIDGKKVPDDIVAEKFALEAERLEQEVEFIGDGHLFRNWRWPIWSLDHPSSTFYFKERAEWSRSKNRVRAEDVVAIETALLEYMKHGSSMEELVEAAPGRGGSDIERSRAYGPGGYSPGVLTCLDGLANDRKVLMAVNVQNNGTVSDLADDVAIETSALIRKDGIWPLNVGHLPPEIRGIIQIHKAYEELTIRAAINGSYEAGIKALTIHPMVSSYRIAKQLLDKYLAAHREYLPLWQG